MSQEQLKENRETITKSRGQLVNAIGLMGGIIGLSIGGLPIAVIGGALTSLLAGSLLPSDKRPTNKQKHAFDM